MAFLMYLSVKHHGPAGQSLSAVEFIFVWLREIVILVLSVFGIVVYLALNILNRNISKQEVSSAQKEENENKSCT